MIWYCPDCTQQHDAIKYAYREIQKAKGNNQVAPTSVIIGCSCEATDFPEWKKKLWKGKSKFGKRIRNRKRRLHRRFKAAHSPEKHNGVGVL